MGAVTPRDALGYALGREMAILYGVVLAGYVAMVLGAGFATGLALRGGGGGLVGQILATVLFLAGFVAAFGGVVGFLYKVIADANAVAGS